MSNRDDELRVVNPTDPLDDQGRAEIQLLAARQRRANGVLMKAINFVGSQVEDGLKSMPAPVRTRFEAAAKKALGYSFHAAKATHGKAPLTDKGHTAVAAIAGAVGGVGGLPTALAELPITTTIIFRAVLSVAESYGEDPDAEDTRVECLRVFGAGGPGGEDDGIDTALIGARLGLSGAGINGLIARISPRFAAVMSQKLAGQAVPIIGAAAGAGTNYAFVRYYVEMAHVHFGLRQLCRIYDETQVVEEFHKALIVRKLR